MRPRIREVVCVRRSRLLLLIVFQGPLSSSSQKPRRWRSQREHRWHHPREQFVKHVSACPTALVHVYFSDSQPEYSMLRSLLSRSRRKWTAFVRLFAPGLINVCVNTRVYLDRCLFVQVCVSSSHRLNKFVHFPPGLHSASKHLFQTDS